MYIIPTIVVVVDSSVSCFSLLSWFNPDEAKKALTYVMVI